MNYQKYSYETIDLQIDKFFTHHELILRFSEALSYREFDKAESLIQSSPELQDMLQNDWFLFGYNKQEALKNHDYEMMEFLFKYNTDFNFNIFAMFINNFDSATPQLLAFLKQNDCIFPQELLMIAINQNNYEIAKTLLDLGVELDNESIVGESLQSPSDLAISCGDSAVNDLLIEYGLAPTEETDTDIINNINESSHTEYAISEFDANEALTNESNQVEFFESE